MWPNGHSHIVSDHQYKLRSSPGFSPHIKGTGYVQLEKRGGSSVVPIAVLPFKMQKLVLKFRDKEVP